MLQKAFTVARHDILTPNIHSLWIDCPDMAAISRPGQFVHLRLPGFLLRRPISLCEIKAERIRLVYEERGAGTQKLAELKPGDSLDILGPLGNGFVLEGADKRVVLVGGGIGTPPLLPLAQHYDSAAVFLGFRDGNKAVLTDDFAAAGAVITISTEDGSLGHSGFVTTPLERHLREHKADILYACGPLPMLKAVKALVAELNITAYFSLEERMACGVGACLGCAVPILTKEGQVYRHVCKDGPVFSAEEVVL